MHRARHFKKRQTSTPASLAGISGASTVANTDLAGSSLVFQSSGIVSQTASAPELATTIPVITTGTVTNSVTTTPSPSPGAESPVANNATSSASSHGVPTGTVIGVCIATVAVLAIALGALCWTRSRDKAIRRVPASAAFRNVNSNLARRKSGREAWARLDDDKQPRTGQDEWTGMSPMRPAPSPNTSARFVTSEKPPQLAPVPISPLESFKFPSPTHSPTLKKQPSLDPSLGAGFDEYHPGLAEELSQPKRLFVREEEGRNTTGSWGGDTLRASSFLSLKSVSGLPADTAAHANALAAIPDTNPFNNSLDAHHAYVADVIDHHQYAAQPRDMNSWDPDSFAEAGADEPPTPLTPTQQLPRESTALDDTHSAIHNPFADALDVAHRHRYKTSNSSLSSDSHASRQSAGTVTLQMMQGATHEEREREMRAMKNLIAALDHPAPGSSVGSDSLYPTAQSRVSAMSGLSGQSEYSQYDESLVSTNFPLPPQAGKGKAPLR